MKADSRFCHPDMRLKIPATLPAGSHLEVELVNEGPLPAGTLRVVRLELAGRDGHPYELYSRNALLASSSQVETFPLTHNDAKGRWRMRAHDLATGQVIEAAFRLD